MPSGCLEVGEPLRRLAWVANGTDTDGVGTSGLAVWTEGGVGPALVDGVDLPQLVGPLGERLTWTTDHVSGVPV